MSRIPFEKFRPRTTALLVIDKQRAYMDPKVLALRGRSLSQEGLARFAKLERLIVAARQTGTPVVWTMMKESVQASPPPIRKKMELDAAAGARLIDARPGMPHYAIFGDVQPTTREAIVPKARYDSFSNPKLTELLKSQRIESLILAGGFASRCVLGTAYGANARDYHVMVAEDAVINPIQYETELPSTRAIVEGILGYYAPVDMIVKNLQNHSAND